MTNRSVQARADHPADDSSPPFPAPGCTVLTESSPAFKLVYEEHFAFVWRNAQRLGIRGPEVDDVVQDVFVVVHRRIADFEPRTSVRAWVFGILTRVVRTHRRTHARKPPPSGNEMDNVVDGCHLNPEELLERQRAAKALDAILDTLSDEQREVFVLVELEEMSGPEISDALSISVNTVYSRLRAAREHFQRGVGRLFAEQRREP
jgi:RNA polymerase sigma-70 factor (ECF subfamily)